MLDLLSLIQNLPRCLYTIYVMFKLTYYIDILVQIVSSCLTRKHTSRMSTACCSDSGAVSLQRPPWAETSSLDREPLPRADPQTLPRQRPPLDINSPPGQRPPPEQTWDQGQKPTGRNMGPGTETPLEGIWDQAARQEGTSCRDPPVDRMTDMCKKHYLAPNFVCGR